ncbi:hypothetical protein CFN78_01195 [Amycolatopsis antarctica]|uniref:ESX secretion-associated protein EspG n=1 Tax=Amycolatopsis antarctica TaxID=1854586 RepID=A0A263D9I7_9PSEU|nr:ESX secretion-associated protein EspG [Amycolatopsis antarctica]OZM74859.1 hypothetical protein CFN78_01195 [Amycolatopsis antarctica]
MGVLRGEVIVSHDCVTVTAEWLNLRLPTPLTPEPLWRNDTERATLHDRVRAELDAEGLLDGDRPSDAFAESLRVLCTGGTEFFAYVDTAERDYRLFAAANGRDAVFACWVPGAGQVLLRPATHDALAEEVVGELPEWVPARGRSMSVPEEDVPRTPGERPARHIECRRLLSLYEQPRYAAGQLHAGIRSGLGGGAKRTEPVTFIDVEDGRWLTYVTVGRDGHRTIVTAPGGRQVTTGKLYELQDQLRERRRA